MPTQFAPKTTAPSLAPSPCAALTLPNNGYGTCPKTENGGKCTNMTCPFGVQEGNLNRLCTDGEWSVLVCKFYAGSNGATESSSFRVNSWQGILSIIAIVAVFCLCVLLLICVLCRWQKKKREKAEEAVVPMSALPPYSPDAGGFRFPESHHPPQPDVGDPFEAEKVPLVAPIVGDMNAAEAAANVRNEQIAAYEQAQQKAQDAALTRQRQAVIAQQEAALAGANRSRGGQEQQQQQKQEEGGGEQEQQEQEQREQKQEQQPLLQQPPQQQQRQQQQQQQPVEIPVSTEEAEGKHAADEISG